MFKIYIIPNTTRRVIIEIAALEEESLQSDPLLLENLISQSNDAIFVIDPETGFFLYVNNKACSNLGYGYNELLHLRVHDVEAVLGDHSAWKEHVKEVQGKGCMLFQGEQKRKDGTTFPVETNVKYIQLEKKAYMIAVARDITERKRVEESLCKQEKALRDITSSLAEGIYVMDKEGNVLFMNPEAEHLLGWTTLELSDKNVHDTVHFRKADGSPLPFEQCGILKVIKNGIRFVSSDEVFVRKNGTVFPISVICSPVIENGRVVASVTAFRDITERKNMEKERENLIIDLEIANKELEKEIAERSNAQEYLRQSEERFRLAMLGATDGLWDRNLQTDEIYYSPRWKTMLGYTDEELENHLDTWKRLLHPDDREPTLALVRDFLEGRADKYEAEFRLCHKDGHYIDILSRGSIIRGVNGEALRFVGTHVDITERKQAEEQIMALNEQLKHQVAKLDAANKELEAFSYSVSHDLRAPLRHMSGFMKLLQKRLGDYPDVATRDYMDAISEASKKMDTLIDDLLAFSRIVRVEMRKKKVSFNTLVKAAIGDIQSETKARDIIWDIDELPDVYGDQSLLSLVFANLISNEVKYTSTRPRAEIKIGYKEEKDEIIFFVKDNGVGFDMKYVDRLFGVFQRLHTQNEFEGNGIGLANVQRIIARHSGRVWAEGAVGQGASFYFTLPKIKET